MAHFTENGRKLTISQKSPTNIHDLIQHVIGFNDVCLLRLPTPLNPRLRAEGAGSLACKIGEILSSQATLIILGNVADLVHIHTEMARGLRYQLWIAIKRSTEYTSPNLSILPQQHFGALVYTKYDRPLQHTKTRLQYTYCPTCDKTTKDYGGKKHTYHAEGTLISDVWRDIAIDPEGDIMPILDRFADLFGLDNYRELRVYDLTAILPLRPSLEAITLPAPSANMATFASQLIQGDCLTELRKLPDNSVDFAFADPPYNLKKSYQGYADDLKIAEYFNWCDSWISEIARILRYGRTFALLNIPLWAIRHFLHLENVLRYQNWIVWDALSFPVRMIMPAHYTILCFSKGEPRSLPGLERVAGSFNSDPYLSPLKDGYCLRAKCISDRAKRKEQDRGTLSDMWGDIHRLKHNTRRVDHPCQLPPQLLYRLISLFTEPGEIVLDCFNGAGTTTLAAHQQGRRYVGIEVQPHYHKIALERHQEIERGLDPFRKQERKLTAKNSPVARVVKRKYEIPKKTLQLEVRRVAELLQHLPSRAEMIEHGKYPIRYYDEYFVSWGEVCAAARTTGMSETREVTPTEILEGTMSQKRLF